MKRVLRLLHGFAFIGFLLGIAGMAASPSHNKEIAVADNACFFNKQDAAMHNEQQQEPEDEFYIIGCSGLF